MHFIIHPKAISCVQYMRHNKCYTESSILRLKKHIDLQMHPSTSFNNRWKLAIQQNAKQILPKPQNFPILEEKKTNKYVSTWYQLNNKINHTNHNNFLTIVRFLGIKFDV
jgi:hypothetical protein